MIPCRSLQWLLIASVAGVALGCNSSTLPDAPEVDSKAASAFRQSEPKVDEGYFLTVTPKAVAVITPLVMDLRKGGLQGPVYLRLRILPGGCSGFMHKLDLDPMASSSTDYVCKSGAILVVVWKSQVEMLRGATIDYGEKDGQRGFMVVNPNIDRVAGKDWLANLEASVPESERPKEVPVPLVERITQFQKMTADDPENELAHYRLGLLFMEDGQYAEAVKSFERTLALSPDFSKVYQLLGESFIKLDRKDRAVEVLTQGWTTADKRGDTFEREAMAKLLAGLGATIPKKAVQ